MFGGGAIQSIAPLSPPTAKEPRVQQTGSFDRGVYKQAGFDGIMKKLLAPSDRL